MGDSLSLQKWPNGKKAKTTKRKNGRNNEKPKNWKNNATQRKGRTKKTQTQPAKVGDRRHSNSCIGKLESKYPNQIPIPISKTLM